MADIPKTDQANFDAQVLKSPVPVIVDFGAVWCGPCKMLDPIVSQLAEEWQGKVKLFKLDIDTNPDLTMQYGVMGVPTLMLFINGSPVQRITGYQPLERIIDKFASHI